MLVRANDKRAAAAERTQRYRERLRRAGAS